MIQYISKNIQFLIVLLSWTLTGMYFSPGLLVLLPLSMIIFIKQDMYLEMLLGFWFMLILSDSFLPQLKFAKDFKIIHILLMLLVMFVKRKKLFVSQNQVILFFMPYFMIAFLVVLKAPIVAVSFQKTLSYLLLFLVIPTCVNYLIYTDSRKFYRESVYFATFLLMLGLIFYLIGAEWIYLAGRFRGLLGNPNGLGLFSALVFIFFQVAMHQDKDMFTKRERNFIYLIIVGNILFCQSRTALFTILLFLLFTRLYKTSPLIGFAAMLIFVFGYQPLFEALPGIITSLGLEEFMRLETLESGSGRYIAWNFAWDEIQKNMFFGNGFNYTEYIFKENYHRLSRLGHEGNAHNSYLTMWLDTGLVGLISFVIPMVLLVMRASKRYPVAMPFFYAIIFSTYFESWLTASLNPFTIVFLLLLSALTTNVEVAKANNKTKLETTIATA